MKRAPLIFFLALASLASCNSQVVPDVTSIVFSRNELTLLPEETYQLKVTLQGGPKEVVYWSSNETVATIGKDGLVTAKNKGTATLMAICDSKQAFCYVTVNEKPVETQVKLRKGNLKIEISAPTYHLPSNVFNAPVSFYQEDKAQDVSFDAKMSLGTENPDQSYQNIKVLREMLAYQKGADDSAVKAYDGLLSQADADPSKKGELFASEAWHVCRFDTGFLSALTTVSEGKEVSRGTRRVNTDEGSLLSILLGFDWSTITFKDLYDSNWRGFLEGLVGESGFPGDRGQDDIKKYGTLVGDLISAVSGGFTIAKTESETNQTYTIAFSEEGRTGLNAWLAKHKDTLKLVSTPTLDKLEFVLTFAKATDAFLGFTFEPAYHIGETANSMKADFTLEEKSELVDKDYIANLKAVSETW